MYLQPKDCNIFFSLDLSTTSLVTVICFTISNDATTELHSEKLDIFVKPPITNKLRLLKVYNVISLLAIEFSITESQSTALLGDSLASIQIKTNTKVNQMHINRLYKTVVGGAVVSWLVRSLEPWPRTLFCVLGQDTLLSRRHSPPRCINRYRRAYCWGYPYDRLGSDPVST